MDVYIYELPKCLLTWENAYCIALHYRLPSRKAYGFHTMDIFCSCIAQRLLDQWSMQPASGSLLPFPTHCWGTKARCLYCATLHSTWTVQRRIQCIVHYTTFPNIRPASIGHQASSVGMGSFCASGIPKSVRMKMIIIVRRVEDGERASWCIIQGWIHQRYMHRRGGGAPWGGHLCGDEEDDHHCQDGGGEKGFLMHLPGLNGASQRDQGAFDLPSSAMLLRQRLNTKTQTKGRKQRWSFPYRSNIGFDLARMVCWFQ